MIIGLSLILNSRPPLHRKDPLCLYVSLVPVRVCPSQRAVIYMLSLDTGWCFSIINMCETLAAATSPPDPAQE